VEREDLLQATHQAFNTPGIDPVLRPITADLDSPLTPMRVCVATSRLKTILVNHPGRW